MLNARLAEVFDMAASTYSFAEKIQLSLESVHAADIKQPKGCVCWLAAAQT